MLKNTQVQLHIFGYLNIFVALYIIKHSKTKGSVKLDIKSIISSRIKN